MLDTATIASILTFAAVVFTAVMQYIRESRAHAWAEQDKMELAAVTTRISTEIKENTDVSTKAFHEANTVNLKLEKLGLTHDEDIKDLIAKSEVRNGAISDLVHEVRTEQVDRKKSEDARVIDALKEDINAIKGKKK